jgi:general stress protein 26
MATELSPALQPFVAEVFPAIVGVKRQNGSVHMTPVWFEFRDGYFWLNSWQGSKWMAQLQRDKTITLMLLDPKNMFRFAEVQGNLVEATTTGADEHIDRLSLRYTGNPTYQNRQPGMQRVMLKIEPTRIHSTLDRG